MKKVNLFAFGAVLGLLSVSTLEAESMLKVNVIHPDDAKKAEVMKPLDRLEFLNRHPERAAEFESCSGDGYCPGGN